MNGLVVQPEVKNVPGPAVGGLLGTLFSRFEVLLRGKGDSFCLHEKGVIEERFLTGQAKDKQEYQESYEKTHIRKRQEMKNISQEKPFPRGMQSKKVNISSLSVHDPLRLSPARSGVS